MSTRKIKKQSNKKQSRKNRATRSKKGGFMSTLATAIVPFGLFGIKKLYEKKSVRKALRMKKTSKFLTKSARSVGKTVRTTAKKITKRR